MKKKWILLWCGVLFALPFLSLRGTNYYVHPEQGGTDYAGTSPLRPFRDLPQLQNLSLRAGDSILLAAGYTFSGTIALREVRGAAGQPVVIGSYQADRSPADPRARIAARGYPNGILIEDGSHIVIRDLIIENNGGGGATGAKMHCGVLVRTRTPGSYQQITLEGLLIRNVFYEEVGFTRGAAEVRTANGSQNYGWGIRFINGIADAELWGLRVSGCRVENVAHTGIKFTGEDHNICDVEVYDNRVLRTGGPGIQLSGVRNGHFHHNYVRYSGSNDDSRKWGRGSGLWTWGSSTVLIEHNQFLDANGPGDSAGCHIDFNCSDVVVQYNFSARNAGGFCEVLGNNYNCAYRYNISVDDGHRVKGENGAFQEGKIFWLSGYRGKRKPREGPFNTYFYNNTIYIGKDIVAKIAVDRAAQGILIANNIFYLAGTSKAVLGDQYQPDTAGPATIENVRFQRNLYLREDNWPEGVLIQDADPRIADPGFVRGGGEQAADYRPTNRRAVKNRGIRIQPLPGDTLGLFNGLQVETDILGAPIRGRPDMGAIELE